MEELGETWLRRRKPTNGCETQTSVFVAKTCLNLSMKRQ